MVASWSLALLDLISLTVYLDLFLVNRFKTHVFAPLIKLLGKQRAKAMQGVYQKSLRRDFFCVSDKVDVSGTTFNTIFCGLYVSSLLSNLLFSA
jgi:hypothetical protein